MSYSSPQMAGTPCCCCIDGWDLHSKLWEIPSGLCLSYLTPICLPTLPSANMGRADKCYTISSSASQKCKKHKLNYRKLQSNTAKTMFCHEYRQTLEHGVHRDLEILETLLALCSLCWLSVFWTGQLDWTMSRGHFPPPSCTESMNQSKACFVAFAI